MNKGLFVVIEGAPHTGAPIQLNLIKERLKAIGYEVDAFDMQNTASGSDHFIKSYQNGSYGKKEEVSPYTATLFYALNRYEISKQIEKALDEGRIVLINRYIGGDAASEGIKFTDPVEQRGFFVWDDNLEYEMLGLQRPDINIYIRSIPTKKEQSPRKEIDKAYDLLCELFPKDFIAVDDGTGSKKSSVAELNEKIWKLIKPKLPKYRPNPSQSIVVTLSEDRKKPSLPQASQASETEKLIVPVNSGSLYLKTFVDRYIPGAVSPPVFSWSENMYQVYRPSGMSKDMQQSYKNNLRQIAKIHEAIKQRFLEKPVENMGPADILLSITPFFALATFEIILGKDQVKELSSALLAQESDELQWLAKQIYLAARQKWPYDFESALESESGTTSINSVLALLPPERISTDSSEEGMVKVLDVTPRQEFDLLAESIYPYSNLSLREITDTVSDWPYSQKYQSLMQVTKQPAILKKVHYKMDIISDQIVLSRMAKAAGLKHIQVQYFTPRYGYDVTFDIEKAGLDDLFTAAFDESLKLYSMLQAAGRDDIAPYAALFGNKVRWQLNSDAPSLKAAFDSRNGSGYNSLIDEVTEAVAQIHPLLWHILSGKVNSQTATSADSGGGRVKSYHQRHKRRPKPNK